MKAKKEPVVNGDFLTTSEAAALLRTTPGSLRTNRSRGLGPPPIRLPGIGVRYRRTDVERWIRQHEGGVA